MKSVIVGITHLCFATVTIASSAIFIGAPGIGVEGNTYAQEPFSLEALGIPSARYQQVYRASEFLAEIPAGGFITDIYFRSDAVFGQPFSAFLPEVQIDLALPPRSPNELSATFDDNIGGSLSVVYPRGGLRFASAGPGDPARITLANPYFYNPANGNLLLQIRNFQQIPPPYDGHNQVGALDAQNSSLDTVSRVFAYDANAVSGTADSLGLVTFFLVTPVPEPSVTVLSLVGIGLLCWCHFKRKRRV